MNRYSLVTVFGESTRLDVQNRIGQSDHLDGYSTVINGHSHRRHPQVRMISYVDQSIIKGSLLYLCVYLIASQSGEYNVYIPSHNGYIPKLLPQMTIVNLSARVY